MQTPDPKTIHLSVEIAVVMIMAVFALIALIYRNLSNRVDEEKRVREAVVTAMTEAFKSEIREMNTDLGDRIGKLEGSIDHIKDYAMDRQQCAVTQKLHEERNLNLHGRIDEMRAANKTEHDDLFSMMRNMATSLNGVERCLSKLTANMDNMREKKNEDSKS